MSVCDVALKPVLSRVLEAGAVAAMQHAVAAAIDKGKAHVNLYKGLADRMTAVERDVADLKGAKRR